LDSPDEENYLLMVTNPVRDFLLIAHEIKTHVKARLDAAGRGGDDEEETVEPLDKVTTLTVTTPERLPVSLTNSFRLLGNLLDVYIHDVTFGLFPGALFGRYVRSIYIERCEFRGFETP